MSAEMVKGGSIMFGISAMAFFTIEIFNAYRDLNLWIVVGIVVGLWALMLLVRVEPKE